MDFSSVPRRPPACGHTPSDSCVQDQSGQGGLTRGGEVDKVLQGEVVVDKVLQVGSGEDF